MKVTNDKIISISEEDLIYCFKFFYTIPENKGDLKTAKIPSDATEYFFKFNFAEEYNEIELYRRFISYDCDRYFNRTLKVCEETTKNGLRLYNNFDFLVSYEKKTEAMRSVYVSKGYKTHNIKAFYNYIGEIIESGVK